MQSQNFANHQPVYYISVLYDTRVLIVLPGVINYPKSSKVQTECMSEL